MNTNQSRIVPVVLLVLGNLVIMLSYAAQHVVLTHSMKRESQTAELLRSAETDLEHLYAREQDLEQRAARLAISCEGSRTVDWR